MRQELLWTVGISTYSEKTLEQGACSVFSIVVVANAVA